MDTKIDLLAMDFDGVIADSIMECAVAGYNAYSTYRGNANQIITPNKINHRQLNLFKSTRPFIRSGEDYIYLFQAISEGINIYSQEDFDRFKNRYIDRKDSYYQLFYSVRQQLITSNFNEWINLNPLYDGMKQFLNTVSSKVHIISTKASKYIIAILSHYAINLKSENIHSTENGFSKSDILLKIITENNFKAQNTVYIDDHLDTLLKMEKTNTNCLLATWGYNTKKQQDEYLNSSIKMVDLKQFYQMYG